MKNRRWFMNGMWGILGILFLSFISCGGTRQQSTATGNVLPSGQAAATEGSGGIVLPIASSTISYTFLISEEVANPHRDSFVVLPELEKRTNIHIEPIWVPTPSYQDKLSVTLASGDIPDFLAMVNTSIANQYGPRGLFLNTWKYINDMPNMKYCFDTYDGWGAYKYSDTELYNLLVQASPDSDPQGFGYYRHIPMIRVDVLDDLHLALPKTFDELYEVLKAIKKAYPTSYPWISAGGDNTENIDTLIEQTLIAWSGDVFSWKDYYTVYDPVTKVYSFALERPGFKELIQYIAKAYKEGLLDPELFISTNGAKWEERMLNNKGFFSYAYWNNSDNITLKAQLNGAAKFKVMGFLPPVKEGNPSVVVRQVCNNTNVVNAKVKNPEIFMRFLDYYLYSKDGTMLANAGIPEVNWIWDVPNSIYKLVDPDKADPTNETHKEKYGVRYGGMTGLRPDHFDIHGYVKDPEANIYYQQQLIYRGKGINPAPVVIYRNSDDADTVKQIGQPITDFLQQRLTRIITGTDGINTWDSIVQESKRMGIDKVLTILNKR